ncbi:MAG: alanine--tRNA ligase [Candidatus Caldatribacteriota bacterium]
MKYMSSKEIRTLFLKFFESKGHKIVPSASLIPADPTILLTIAGMVPFKPIFLGQVKSAMKRATTCQKCVRTNDIENVGRTARHHTFFEMLGNFSFGDYFKKEAIQWSWELFTEVIGFPKEKLWVSIYKDDEEAYDIWHNLIGIPDHKIIRLGEEDNFWKVGPTGPCGPCSEIYIDLGSERASTTGGGVGVDGDRYLELWNLVFMQYNRNEDGSLTPLPKKNIDTGLGLERIASVLQGAHTDFETDLFLPIINFVAQNAGVKYQQNQKIDLALKVIADHMRALVFMIADGIMPSNEGRGYVLRMLLRRAFRYGRALNFNQPFLFEIAPVVIDMMQDVYPELFNSENQICQIILSEEKKFQETLSAGIQILENMKVSLKKENKLILNGEEAFKLYDTYGFPIELTRELLQEDGFTVNELEFEQAMELQKEKSRKIWSASKIDLESDKKKKEIFESIQKEKGETIFIGYDSEKTNAQVLAIIKEGQKVELASRGEKCEIVLDKTPFYAEKGGQIGDQGEITSLNGKGFKFKVTDTQSPLENLIIHYGMVEEGEIRTKETVIAQVDRKRRMAIARNHTSTHLLHQALREVLGQHVKQAGSLVTEKHFRFDFTHFTYLQKEELKRIEERVNEKILEDLPVEKIITSLEQAQKLGAIALFDEKYGDKVRVIKIGDYSLELCGGTHLDKTSSIGLFKILNEQGIGSNIRRIEAVTGEEALKYIQERDDILSQAAQKLDVLPADINHRLNQILEEINNLKREIKVNKNRLARYELNEILKNIQIIQGIKIVSTRIEASDNEELRYWGDLIREKIESGVILLGTAINQKKAILLVMVTNDLVEKGLDAVKIINYLAPLIGGKGGGKKSMAQAGGAKIERLNQVFEKIYEFFK